MFHDYKDGDKFRFIITGTAAVNLKKRWLGIDIRKEMEVIKSSWSAQSSQQTGHVNSMLRHHFVLVIAFFGSCLYIATGFHRFFRPYRPIPRHKNTLKLHGVQRSDCSIITSPYRLGSLQCCSDCKVWNDDGGFSVLAMLDDLNTVKYWSTIIQSHDDLALHIGLKFFQDLFIPARLVCKKF